MNGNVRLIYTEFDPNQPPFSWICGRRLAAGEDRSEVYRVMATISAAAKMVERPGARAMRYLDDGKTMLVELDLSQTDPGGAPVRLTVVLVVDRSTPRHLTDCARKIIAELAMAGVTANEGRVRDALEWGRANSALRFPRISALCRRILGKARRGRGYHSIREVEAS